MIKNILTNMGGIDNYGIISLSLFIVFFLGILIWAFALKKPYLEDMAGAPLEPKSKIDCNSDNDHE